MTTKEREIWNAEFNDSVTTYWLLTGMIVCVVSVVGIVLLPLWYIIGKWATRKYLESHECILTNRTLKVKKGILTKIEKTVPLDRITDMGIVQGPIMRWLDIEALTVETAGQSGVGSLVQLAGIKDGRNFRDAVLNQRDLVVGSKEEGPSSVPAATDSVSGNETVDLLRGIKDSLNRIEKSIGNLKN